jgi:hypothetical protein
MGDYFEASSVWETGQRKTGGTGAGESPRFVV